MKNIEQILKDAGIEVTEEQLKTVNGAVTENYKPIADYNKQVKKTEAAETDRDTYKGQLETANATLEKFKDIDPEKISEEIESYKQQAADAEAKAQKQIAERDQKDFLKSEFDKLGITSERTRKSLMTEIMDEKDGLRWKDGTFLGLSDFLEKENEKDHFYQTDEEKKAAEDKQKEEEAKQKAAGSVPKFTDKSEPKKEPPKDNTKVPAIF